MAKVLKHERFERSPVELPKRRRGRLPRGVVSIQSAPRLRVGAVAEIAGSRTKANHGIRVRIVGYDPNSSWCWECKSLDRKIQCNDGSVANDAWFKGSHLRRVWTGLSESERIQLALRRAAS